MLKKAFFGTILAALALLSSSQLAMGSFFSDAPVFRMATIARSIEWNPLFYYSSTEAQIFTGIYEGLFSYHPQTQRPEGAAAESWTLSADKKTYRFKLRKNGRFSNGDPLTAEDFRQTWITLLSYGDSAPFSSLLDPIKGAREWRTNTQRDPAKLGIRAIDTYTLEIELAQATGHFLQILCHQSMVPVHKSMLGLRSWPKTGSLIGNGPFVCKDRTLDQILLEKSATYWDAANVSLASVEISISEDLDTMVSRFNSRQMQWLSGGASYNLVGDKKSFVVSPQFATHFMFFNNRNKVLADSKVKRGLALLIDFAKLRDPDVYYIPTAKLIPALPNYPSVKTLTESKREEGLKLLAEAGFPDGQGLPELLIFLPEGDDSERIAKVFQDAWSILKIKTIYKPYKELDYNDQLQSSDYAIGTMSWIGDYVDPMTFLELFSARGSLNIAGLNDQAFENEISKSILQQGTERYKTLAKAEEILLSSGACIPLNHSPAVNIIDLEQVDGWYENPFDLHPFKTIKPKTPKPPRNIARL